MVKSKLTVSTLALSAAIFFAVPAVSDAKEKAVINLTPQTGWMATMIEGALPADGYCALTRKYDQGLVLTLGQSARDEYSLAIDFQNQKLNTDKPYKITLQPGPGQIRAYEMMPASPQAMVIRIGYDQDFLQSLQKSGQLKISMDGKNYEFVASNMTQGRADLKKCMAGLKGEDVTKTASFSAEKIENSEFEASPIQLAKNEAVAPAAPTVAEKKAPVIPVPKRVATEKKKIAMVSEAIPETIIAPEPEIIPVKAVKAAVQKIKPEAKTPEVKEVVKEEVKAKKPIQISRIESKTVVPKSAPLKSEVPVVEAPKVEVTPIVTPDPIVKPAIEKTKTAVPEAVVVAEADIPKMEDKKLSKNTRVSLAPEARKRISERPDSVAATNKRYGSAINVAPSKAVTELEKAPQKSEPVNVAELKQEKIEPVRMPEVRAPEVKVEKSKPVKIANKKKPIPPITPDLMDETRFPKPFSKSAKKSVEKTDKPKEVIADIKAPRAPEADAPVEKAGSELQEAQDENARLTAELQAKEKKIAAVKTPSPEEEKERVDIQKELRELEKENRQLYREAIQARGEIDTAVAKTSSEALKQMQVYEKKLDAANQDNLALAKELEELRRVKEDAAISALSGDPAAQQSMQRYNEAEREIKRLGLLLEQQRLSHRQEKVELEDMLFDPAVTDEAQRRKLAELEKRLADAERRFQAESQKVNKVDAGTQKKMQDLERKLAEAKAKEQKIKSEEEKVKAEAKRVAAAEVKLATLAQKEQMLKLKEQKLLIEQKKISAAESSLAQAKAKEQELKAAEIRIQAEAQKIAQAEAKLAEAKRKEQLVLAAEAKMKAEAQRMAQAEAKLAEARRKEQAVLAAEKSLQAKTRALAAAETEIQNTKAQLAAQGQRQAQAQVQNQYSRDRIVPKAPMAITNPSAPRSPATIAPSARNVRSNVAFGQGQLQSILSQSGLSSVSKVVQQAAGRYSWNAAGMSGRAEVISNSQSLEQFMQSYLVREKQNCRGDFASLPSAVPTGKKGYEIACVGSNGGTSSSVVFIQRGKDLIAIKHETSAENMDAAIDARDRVAKRL